MTDGLVVTEEGFPHGVRCIDCDRPLTPGMPYSHRLEAMAGGAPVVEVICVACAYTGATQ